MRKAIIIGIVMLLCLPMVIGSLTDGLKHYYEFENNVSDLVGTLDLVNDQTADGVGIISRGREGDGTVHMSSHNSLLGYKTNFTYSMWVYFDDKGTNKDFIDTYDKVGADSDNRFILRRRSTEQYRVYLYEFNANQVAQCDTGVIQSKNAWSHIGVVYDGNDIDFYVNGTIRALTCTINASGTFVDDTRNLTVLSDGSGANEIDGRIDELGIWNISLSASNITKLYNSGAGLAYPLGAGAPPPASFPENNLTIVLKDKKAGTTLTNWSVTVSNKTITQTFSGRLSLNTNLTLNGTNSYNLSFFNINYSNRPFSNKSYEITVSNSSYSFTGYANPYSKITSNDFYNATALLDFIVLFNSKNYTPTNGKVYLPSFNQSILVNLTKTNYFSNETTYNSSNDLTIQLIPYTLILAEAKGTGTKLNNYAVTLNSKEYETTIGRAYIPLKDETAEVTILNVTDGVGYASETINLTASPYLQNYTFSLYVTNSFNIIFYDEQTNARIPENVSTQLNIYGESGGNLSSITITNHTYFVSLLVPDMYRINYIVDGYEENNYYQLLTNQSFTNITLFSMPSNASFAELRIRIKDSASFDDFPNIIAIMQRLYIEEGTWKTVQMDLSGEFGEGYFDIIEKTEDYRFLFINLSSAVLEQTNAVKFSCDSGICEVTFVISSTGTIIDSQNLFVSSDLTNQNENGTIVWNDPTGASHSVTAIIRRETIQGYVTIYNSTQSGSGGTFDINLSAQTGEAQVIFIVDGERELSFSEQLSRALLPNLLGGGEEEGIWWGFGIGVTVAMMGLFSALGAIVFTIIGLMVVLWLGLSSVLGITFIILASIIGIAIGLRIKQ